MSVTVLIVIGFIAAVGIGVYVGIQQESAPPNPEIVCPHCQSKGTVKTRRVKRKNGISGGKATGALLTGGMSLVATGLSHKATVTNMHCLNCNTRWDV